MVLLQVHLGVVAYHVIRPLRRSVISMFLIYEITIFGTVVVILVNEVVVPAGKFRDATMHEELEMKKKRPSNAFKCVAHFAEAHCPKCGLLQGEPQIIGLTTGRMKGMQYPNE